MRPPGFEPGPSAWQADILTRLDYGRAQPTYTFQRDINLLSPSKTLPLRLLSTRLIRLEQKVCRDSVDFTSFFFQGSPIVTRDVLKKDSIPMFFTVLRENRGPRDVQDIYRCSSFRDI